MTQWTCYLDEAGNTGANFIDPQQPFFITAGWIVPAQLTEMAEGAITSIQTEAPELHGRTLVKHYKGQGIIRDLILRLLDIGCTPIWSIAEKRYCVAAKMVETFLDPAYNRRIGYRTMGDTTLKQGYANQLYQLPQDTLERFAQGYRTKDHVQVGHALEESVAWLRKRGAVELGTRLAGAFEKLEEVMEDEKLGLAGVPAGGTLNLPIFVQILGMIETVARKAGDVQVQIIHDESKQFSGYDFWYNLVQGKSEKTMSFPNDAEFYLGLHRVSSLRQAQSHAEPLLQGADVLASALYTYASYRKTNTNPQSAIMDIAKALLPSLTVSANQQVAFVGSSPMMNLMFRPLRRLMT